MSTQKKADYPTVDELIATLGHSKLPTLLTEGRDDFEIFRRLEERCANLNLSVLAAGSKQALMDIFDRRSEIKGGPKLAFFVDQDFWTLAGVPLKYQNQIFLYTSGYSIENDLYVDGEIETLMTTSEMSTFKAELDRIIRWYACAMEKKMRGVHEQIDHHPNYLLGLKGSSSFLPMEIELDEEQNELYKFILDNYPLLLRGKTLIALALRLLSETSRPAKFSRRALLEIGFARNGPVMKTAYEKLDNIFGTT